MFKLIIGLRQGVTDKYPAVRLLQQHFRLVPKTAEIVGTKIFAKAESDDVGRKMRNPAMRTGETRKRGGRRCIAEEGEIMGE